MAKTVFITGATSGIGHSTAILLAHAGYRIIACGRRQDRLEKLRKMLEKDNSIITLQFDVRVKEEVQKAISSLPEEWQEIDILINNAGNAHGLSSIEEGKLEDWDAMIDINLKGLLYVSKAVVPLMAKRKKGHIINIGSLAGREVYPNGNVYCATKHAVDALTAAMRIDLNKHNIKVSQLAPGLVETEFSLVRFKGDQDLAKMVYEGYEALKAEDIAELIYFMVSRPAHVNLADVLILPAAQASSTLVRKQEKEED